MIPHWCLEECSSFCLRRRFLADSGFEATMEEGQAKSDRKTDEEDGVGGHEEEDESDSDNDKTIVENWLRSSVGEIKMTEVVDKVF